MPELIPFAPLSPAWRAARRQGVTATDIVTILGLSSWLSPYSLFWQKMGQVPEPADNDRWRLGRYVEFYAAERWLEDHRDWTAHDGALYRHSDRPWQMATLDRLAQQYGATPGTQLPPLEVKSWADADRRSWQDGPPPAVRAQVLWQMDVMDVATGHVGVVFLPSGEFRSYVIEHDHSGWTASDPAVASYRPEGPFCTACDDLGLMRAVGEEFMRRLRLELPAPDPDASTATLAAVKARFTKAPDKTAEVDAITWADWSACKKEADNWAEMARGCEIRLREQAGEASVLTVDGQPVARRITGEAQVKAHVRHSDYLKRIAPKETDSE